MKATTAYLIIEPRHDWQGRLESVAVDRIVKSKPTKLSPRYVAVELHIEVDDSLFEQFLPAATIHLRDTRDLITPTVEVREQEEPDATEEPSADEILADS